MQTPGAKSMRKATAAEEANTMIEIEAPQEFMCPLTLDIMSDPVMSKYGQSFERSEILQWLKAGHGVCPLSRRPLSLQDLVTNHALRCKIDAWRKDNGQESVVIVNNPANQIYGFITIPNFKDDSTDRTLDEEDDLLYLHLASMRSQRHQASTQESSPEHRSRRRQQRQRRNTFSAPSSSSRQLRQHQEGEEQHNNRRRPFRRLRNFLTFSHT